MAKTKIEQVEPGEWINDDTHGELQVTDRGRCGFRMCLKLPCEMIDLPHGTMVEIVYPEELQGVKEEQSKLFCFACGEQYSSGLWTEALNDGWYRDDVGEKHCPDCSDLVY